MSLPNSVEEPVLCDIGVVLIPTKTRQVVRVKLSYEGHGIVIELEVVVVSLIADVLRWKDTDLNVQGDRDVYHSFRQPVLIVMVLVLIFIIKVTRMTGDHRNLCGYAYVAGVVRVRIGTANGLNKSNQW